MKRNLTPVTGLAIASLIGVGYAQCYWEVTDTCANESEEVDAILFSQGVETVYADETWFKPWHTTQNLGGYGRTDFTYPRCFGAAYFENPITSATEYISWWESGTGGFGVTLTGEKPNAGNTCP